MRYFLSFIIFSVLISVYQFLSVTPKIGLKCGFSNRKINCENLLSGNKLECDSVSNISGLSSTFFNIFGIGTLPNGYHSSVKATSSVSLFLYPRTLDPLVYLNHTIELNGKRVNLSLYNDLTNTGSGIRITDSLCYAKLLDLVDQVQKLGTHTVKVKANLFGETYDLVLVGEVTIGNQGLWKRLV